MLRFTLLVSTIALATAGLLNWEEFRGPHHQNDAYYKQLEWLYSKRQQHKISQEKNSVCRTKECFKIAAEFWESMNKSVDPCEDFYEYACGSWKIHNPIPPSEVQWSPLDKMQKAIDYKIRDLLEESVHPDDVLPVKQVKKFYQSCMNIEAREKLGIKPLEAILVRNGGWPVIMEPGEWDPEEFSWKQIHDYYTHLAQISALYTISVTYDMRSRNAPDENDLIDIDDLRKVIRISFPGLPSVVLKPGQSFDRDKMYEDGTYAKLITEVALIFAAEREAHVDKKQIEKDVQAIIEVEKIIRNHRADEDYNPVYFTFDELQEYYDNNATHRTSFSKINWKKTINDLFIEANVKLDENEIVKLGSVKFLNRLSNLLDEINPRTLVNYIHWHFLSNMLPYTSSKIQELEYHLKKEQAGVKEETPRWQTCVDIAKMEDAVSYLFVKKYFQDEMKLNTEKIISNIKKEMTKHILKADWLDDSIRKMVLEKIKKMRQNIGYPDWYNNITMVNNNYRGLPIGHDFLSNVLSYQKYSLKRDLRNLKVKPRQDEWLIHPIVVNAYYSPDENSITIPAADFQLPFYTAEKIQTLNYGALGVVLGHEISHGFDNRGIKYDSKGDILKWPTNADQKYKNKAKCFVNQYINFYPESLDKNTTSDLSEMNRENDSIEAFFKMEIQDIASMKLGENIADSLGVETTFNAFEDQENEKKQPKLPGFEDLDNEQLFFLTFSKLWCENTTPEFNKLVSYDTHSKARYRVIAPLQNSEAFAKAYNCPAGSAMNPEIKCKLWK